jgi:hypothetical protein
MAAKMAPERKVSGGAQAGEGAFGAGAQGANIPGAATRGGAEYGAERPNLGSARSDYGELAYGGSLDESGEGGKSLDDFSQGRVDRGSRGYSTAGSPAKSGGSSAGGGSVWMLLVGIGVGAGLMYLLDPERGRTRRKLLGDKLVAWTNDLTDAAGATARDLRNRAKGVVAEARGAVRDYAEGVGLARSDSSSRQSQQGGQAAQ